MARLNEFNNMTSPLLTRINKNHHIKFVFALTLILIAIFGLGFAIYLLANNYPELPAILFIQCINALGCYVLLGVGVGLPLVFLASVLGWVQLILLVNGNINPHLAREGFFKVLTTLFSKI